MPWAIKNTEDNKFLYYDDSNGWTSDVNDAALYRSSANATTQIKKKLRYFKSLEDKFRNQRVLDLLTAFQQTKVVRVELNEIKEI